MSIHNLTVDCGKAFGKHKISVMIGISGHGFLSVKLCLPSFAEKMIMTFCANYREIVESFSNIEVTKELISNINRFSIKLDSCEDEFYYFNLPNLEKTPIKQLGIKVEELKLLTDEFYSLARAEFAINGNSENSMA